jgi:hypothetical protein
MVQSTNFSSNQPNTETDVLTDRPTNQPTPTSPLSHFNHHHKSTKLRALVLELYGTGNAASKKTGLLQAVEVARKRGIVGEWRSW